MELRSFIDLDEAISMGAKYRPKLKSKKVPALEAVGKFSSSDVESPSDFPPHDRSAMDGYALSSSETISSSRTNPSHFSVIGRFYPSSRVLPSIRKGEAASVTTGSKIPRGADSVAMLEETNEDENGVSVYAPVRKFQNVSRTGEDLKKGYRILKRGASISPPHVSALLECGMKRVGVISLSIGVISTGDELVEGLIRNSTQPMLMAYFQRKGFETVGHEPVRDRESEIETALARIPEDIIIATGGTGPGESDLLPSVIQGNGGIVFRGLKIRPGRTTSFGVFRGKPVFMVSGLPVAALIASENFILRVISKWFGLVLGEKEYREGILGRSVVNTLGFRSFVRVKVQNEASGTVVYPSRVTGSGVIYSMIDADGILVIDENSEGIQEGERVTYEVIRW